MKLMNYDARDLIMQNVRSTKQETPVAITKSQYNILCRLIKQKKITKPFFELLLRELYNLEDWKQLSYEQMYELIHILTYFDYTRIKMN